MLEYFKTLKQQQESMVSLRSFQGRKQSILRMQSDYVNLEMPKRQHRHSASLLGWKSWLVTDSQKGSSAHKKRARALPALHDKLLTNSE